MSAEFLDGNGEPKKKGVKKPIKNIVSPLEETVKKLDTQNKKIAKLGGGQKLSTIEGVSTSGSDIAGSKVFGSSAGTANETISLQDQENNKLRVQLGKEEQERAKAAKIAEENKILQANNEAIKNNKIQLEEAKKQKGFLEIQLKDRLKQALIVEGKNPNGTIADLSPEAQQEYNQSVLEQKQQITAFDSQTKILNEKNLNISLSSIGTETFKEKEERLKKLGEKEYGVKTSAVKSNTSASKAADKYADELSKGGTFSNIMSYVVSGGNKVQDLIDTVGEGALGLVDLVKNQVSDPLSTSERKEVSTLRQEIYAVKEPYRQGLITNISSKYDELVKRKEEVAKTDGVTSRKYNTLKVAESKLRDAKNKLENTLYEDGGATAENTYNSLLGWAFKTEDSTGDGSKDVHILEGIRNEMSDVLLDITGDDSHEVLQNAVTQYQKDNKKKVENLTQQDYEKIYSTLPEENKLYLEAMLLSQNGKQEAHQGATGTNKAVEGIGGSFEFMATSFGGVGKVNSLLKSAPLIEKLSVMGSKYSRMRVATQVLGSGSNTRFIRGAMTEGAATTANLLKDGAIASVLNPRMINDEFNKIGYEATKGKDGKTTSVLSRDVLANYAINVRIPEEKKSYNDLWNRLKGIPEDQLSEEDLKTKNIVGARLGLIEKEGIDSFDQEEEKLKEYLDTSDTTRFVKGVLKNSAEIASEAYTGKALGIIGKEASLIVKTETPGLYKVFEKTGNFAKDLSTKLNSTRIGNYISNYQKSVNNLMKYQNQNVIGSVPEEILEEYIVAGMNSVIDFDTQEFLDSFSKDFLVDVSVQTLGMNAIFGGSSHIQNKYKQIYGKLGDNKIEKINSKIAELKKNQKEIEDRTGEKDLNTPVSIKQLEKEKADFENNRSLFLGNNVLGGKLSTEGSRTGFSATRQFIETRKRLQESAHNLRYATEDDQVKQILDIASTDSITNKELQRKISLLRMQGKKDDASLLERKLQNNLIADAFKTNTQDRLESSIDKALSNGSNLSKEVVEGLLDTKKKIAELKEFQEKNENNPAVSVGTNILSSKISTQRSLKDLLKNRQIISNDAESEFSDLIDVNFDPSEINKEEVLLAFRTGNLHTLLEKELDGATPNYDAQSGQIAFDFEGKEPAVKKLYELLMGDDNTFKQASGYYHSVLLEDMLRKDIAAANISLHETMNPSREIKNSRQVQRKVNNIFNDLKNNVNTLELENLEKDEDNKLLVNANNIGLLYDAIRKDSVGEVNKGKVSSKYYESMKQRTLEVFNKNAEASKNKAKIIEIFAQATQELENENDNEKAVLPITSSSEDNLVVEENGSVTIADLPEVETEAIEIIVGSPELLEDHHAVTEIIKESIQENFTSEVVIEEDIFIDHFPGPKEDFSKGIDKTVIDPDFGEESFRPQERNPENVQKALNVIEAALPYLHNLFGDYVYFTDFMQYVKLTDKQSIKIVTDNFGDFISAWQTSPNFTEVTAEQRMLAYKALTEMLQMPEQDFDRVQHNANVDTLEKIGSFASAETESTIENTQENTRQEENAKKEILEDIQASYTEENAVLTLANEEEMTPDKEGVQIKAGYNAVPYKKVWNEEEERYEYYNSSNELNVVPNGNFITPDFRELINPENDLEDVQFGYEVADEKDWDKIIVNEFENAQGEKVYQTFAQLVAEKEAQTPGFRTSKEFRDEIPVFIVNSKGDKLVHFHAVSWYVKNDAIALPTLEDQDEESTEQEWENIVERKLSQISETRRQIISGEISGFTIERKDSGVWGRAKSEVIEGEETFSQSYVSVRESNPQASIIVNSNYSTLEEVVEHLLPAEFSNGEKILEFVEPLPGRVYAIHRSGSVKNKDGKLVPTYTATIVNKLLFTEEVETVRIAMAVHKVLKATDLSLLRLPADLMFLKNIDKKTLVDTYVKPIEKATSYNIEKAPGMGSFINLYLRATNSGLDYASKRYEEKGKSEMTRNADGTSLKIIEKLLEDSSINESAESLLRTPYLTSNVNRTGVVSTGQQDNKVVKLTPKGVEVVSEDYQEYIKDKAHTEFMTYNVAKEGQPEVRVLKPQPFLLLSPVYGEKSPVNKEVEKATEEIIQENTEAVEKIQEVAVAVATMSGEETETKIIESAREIFDSLNLGTEFDFNLDTINNTELGDESFTGIKALKNSLLNGSKFEIEQEEDLRFYIASLIIERIKFKAKIGETTKKEIKAEIKQIINEMLYGRVDSNPLFSTKGINDKIKALETLIAGKEDSMNNEVLAIVKTISQTKGYMKNLEEEFDYLFNKSLKDVEKLAKVEVSQEDVEDSLADEEVETEKNYSRSDIEDKVKDKASARLKMLFYGIPVTDNKGNFEKGFLGFPKLMPLNDVYNLVLRHLHNGIDPDANFEDLYNVLDKEDSKTLKIVLQRLATADEQIKHEFTSNVAAHHLTSKFIMYNSQNGKSSFKVFETNSAEITRAIREIWDNQLIASNLYNAKGDINEVYAREILDSLAKLPSSTKHKDFDYTLARNILEKMGITFKDKSWKELVEDGITSDNKKRSFEMLYTSSPSKGGLFKSIESFLKEGISNPETFNINTGDTFTSNLNNVVKGLAKIESKNNPQLVSLSFRDSGKQISTITNPKYFTDQVAKLLTSAKTDQKYIQDLMKLSFNGDSLILDSLMNTGNFSNLFEVSHVAMTAIKKRKEKRNTSEDNKINNIPSVDYLFTALGAFLDTKVSTISSKVEGGKAPKYKGFNIRLAHMLSPTMSDKDQAAFVTAPVINFNATTGAFNETDNVSQLLGEEVLELMVDTLVKPEIARILNLKNKGISKIKGYEDTAQLFFLVPSLNALEIEGVTLPKYLNTLSPETTAEEVIAQIGKELQKEVNTVLYKNIESTAKVIKEIEEESKTSMINQDYYTAIGKSKNTGFTPAIADFVLNSFIFNAEMFKVFIGDPALYSDKKYLTRIGRENDKTATAEEKANWKFEMNLDEALGFVEKTGVNLGKRLALLLAPGKRISTFERDEKYLQLLLKDQIDISENAAYLIKLYHGEEGLSQMVQVGNRKVTVKNALEVYRNKSNQLLSQKYSERAKTEKLLGQIRKNIGNIFEDISSYFDIESTDAQEYTTFKEHLHILYGTGKLTKQQYRDTLAHYNATGEVLADSMSLILQPMKPVQTGTYIDIENDINRTVYIKSSSFPLIPALTKGTHLEGLRVAMEKLEDSSGKYVRASYQTANKVGSVETSFAIDAFNQEDLDAITHLNANKGDSAVLELDRRNFRLQQDVPFKSGKKAVDKIAMGTQIFKLLFSDGIINEKGFKLYPDSEEDLSGEELYNKFNDAFGVMFDTHLSKLYEELGISSKTGMPEDTHSFVEKLKTLLIAEAESRNYPLKSIEGLQTYEFINSKGQPSFDFITPLWLSSDSEKYEALLNSILTNRIMKQKIHGYSFVVGSEAGLSLKEEQELTAGEKNGIVYTSSFNGKRLQSVKTQDGKLLKAQVFVTPKIRTSSGKLIDLMENFVEGVGNKYIQVDEKGKLTLRQDYYEDRQVSYEKDGEVINETRKVLVKGSVSNDVLNLFSFRVPTSSHVSGATIEIAGFLPASMGDLMIVPKSFTKQKGLDFDIDKENTYMLNTFTDKNGNIRPVEELGEIVSKTVESKMTPIQKMKVLSAYYNNLKQIKNSTKYYDIQEKLKDRDLLNKEILLPQLIEEINKKINFLVAENVFVRSHLAVYNNPNKEVQQKLNKVLSIDFAKDQAERFETWKKEKETNQKLAVAKGTTDNIEQALKVVEEDKKSFSLLTYDYQKNKMDLGSIGKFSIGVYAVATTFNGLLHQSFKGEVQKVYEDVVTEDEVIDKNTLHIGEFTSNGVGYIDTIRPNNHKGKTWEFDMTTAESFAEKENTATDNEKEQILGRVGINKDTIAVDSYLTLRGFGKDVNGRNYLSYLMVAQPIVQEYVDMRKNNKSLFKKYTKEADIIETLLNKYSTGETYKYNNGNVYTVKNDETTYVDKYNPEIGRKLSSKVLEDNLKIISPVKQVEALIHFLRLKDEAGKLTNLMSTLNTNTLGKSSLEANEKYSRLMKNLGRKKNRAFFPSFNTMIGREYDEEMPNSFEYIQENNDGEFETKYIVPNTPQGRIATYGVIHANNWFSPFFPYESKVISTLLGNTFLQGGGDLEFFNVEERNKILKELKKYIYSSKKFLPFVGDAHEKRKELFVETSGNTSLSKYILQLKNLDPKGEYKKGLETVQKNVLIGKKLTSKINKGEGVSTIVFNNQASDNISEEALYGALTKLVVENYPLPPKNGKDYTTRDLVEDLIYYSFLEGGVQEAVQFIKFIPVNLLNSLGKKDKNNIFWSMNDLLQRFNPERHGENSTVFEGLLGVEEGVDVQPFVLQYYQNNIDKLRNILNKKEYKINDKDELIKYGTKEDYNHPIVKVKVGDEFVLYVKQLEESFVDNKSGQDKVKAVYVQVPSFGHLNISNYENGKTFSRDLYTRNKEAENAVSGRKVNKPTSSVSNDFLDLSQVETVKDALKQILSLKPTDNNRHLIEVAKFFLNNGERKVQGNKVSDDASILGTGLYIDNTIKINSESIRELKGVNPDFIVETLLHEIVHAYTVPSLNKYFERNESEYSLKEGITIPQHVQDLVDVYDTYVASLDQKKLTEFKDYYKMRRNFAENTPEFIAAEKFFSDLRNSTEGVDEFIKYYSAINIKEFVAHLATDKDYIYNVLNKIDTKKKGLVNKLINSLLELLSDVIPGLKEDKLAYNAIQTLFNFTINENKEVDTTQEVLGYELVEEEDIFGTAPTFEGPLEDMDSLRKEYMEMEISEDFNEFGEDFMEQDSSFENDSVSLPSEDISAGKEKDPGLTDSLDAFKTADLKMDYKDYSDYSLFKEGFEKYYGEGAEDIWNEMTEEERKHIIENCL